MPHGAVLQPGRAGLVLYSRGARREGRPHLHRPHALPALGILVRKPAGDLPPPRLERLRLAGGSLTAGLPRLGSPRPAGSQAAQGGP